MATFFSYELATLHHATGIYVIMSKQLFMNCRIDIAKSKHKCHFANVNNIFKLVILMSNCDTLYTGGALSRRILVQIPFFSLLLFSHV